MNTIHDTYTTRLGTEFKFAFVPTSGGFEIHIIEQPSYGDRSDTLVNTHRHTTDDGFKVCWTGTMASLTDAKNVAAGWAYYTERYILTGQPFPTK